MYVNSNSNNPTNSAPSTNPPNSQSPQQLDLNDGYNWSPHQSSFPPISNNEAGQSTVGGGDGFNSISSRQLCVARFAYSSAQPDELTFNRGANVRVLEKSSDGWWRGVLMASDGKPTQNLGWFPSNYVIIVDNSRSSEGLVKTFSSSMDDVFCAMLF